MFGFNREIVYEDIPVFELWDIENVEMFIDVGFSGECVGNLLIFQG